MNIWDLICLIKVYNLETKNLQTYEQTVNGSQASNTDACDPTKKKTG